MACTDRLAHLSTRSGTSAHQASDGPAPSVKRDVTAMLSPVIKPKAFARSPSRQIDVEFEQRVFKLERLPLDGEWEHDLKDETVKHAFG